MAHLAARRVTLATFRRSLVALVLAAPFALALGSTLAQPAWQSEEPRSIAPPGDVPEALKKRMAEAREALVSDRLSTNDLLWDAQWSPLRPYTEFREVIRAHTKQPKACLAPKNEPGDRLRVSLRVVDRDKQPHAGVLVYAYQTDARGWYAAEAPHISGGSGDYGHARLFGYGRTDAKGTCGLTTVRPAGYPRSDMPQHIHLTLTGANGEELDTEILFNDDPRLTPQARKESAQYGTAIAKVTRDGDAQRCEVEFVLARAKPR